MYLPAVNPGVFKYFLDWLYFRIGFFDEGEASECKNCGNECVGEVWDRANCLEALDVMMDQQLEAIIARMNDEAHEYLLYAFAYQHDVPKLRKDIVDAAWVSSLESSTRQSVKEVVFLSRLVPESDPLYRFIVHRLLCRGSEDLFWCPLESALAQKLPKATLVKLRLGMECDGWEVRELCKYHEHPQDLVTRQACHAEREQSRRDQQSEINMLNEYDQVPMARRPW